MEKNYKYATKLREIIFIARNFMPKEVPKQFFNRPGNNQRENAIKKFPKKAMEKINMNFKWGNSP